MKLKYILSYGVTALPPCTSCFLCSPDVFCEPIPFLFLPGNSTFTSGLVIGHSAFSYTNHCTTPSHSVPLSHNHTVYNYPTTLPCRRLPSHYVLMWKKKKQTLISSSNKVTNFMMKVPYSWLKLFSSQRPYLQIPVNSWLCASGETQVGSYQAFHMYALLRENRVCSPVGLVLLPISSPEFNMTHIYPTYFWEAVKRTKYIQCIWGHFLLVIISSRYERWPPSWRHIFCGMTKSSKESGSFV